MPLGSDADLLFMLRDAGDVVVYNGVSSYGILEHGDAVQPTDQGGMVQVRVSTLLIATNAFADLRTNGKVVVAGKPYRIDGPPMLEDDGALTRLTLARLT